MMPKINIYQPLFLILLTISACSLEQESITQPTDSENEVIVAKGEAIAMSLVKTLKGEVKQAIDSNGVVAAITLCNDIAIPLTHKVESLAEDAVSIKRATFKPRNPANKPDKIETEALQFFEGIAANGEAIPPHYTQKVISKGDTSYFYYKPMKIEPLCLLCHGTDETIMPEVKENIAKLYPEDKAIGYREGDFRGVIRVKLTKL